MLWRRLFGRREQEAAPMLLMVGLGNPGPKYARHRHNIGFMAVDAIAQAHGFGAERRRFQGLAREGRLAGDKALILKPQTFMNESGRAVGEAVRFYKLEPSQVVVFYDELDLAAGKVRVKQGGGHAGHNGLRSVIAHVGADVVRVRLGIGHPGHKEKVLPHVLSDFAKADAAWLDPLIDALAAEVAWLARGEPERFQTAVAQRIAPPRSGTGTGRPEQAGP